MLKNRNDKTKDAGPQKLSLESAVPAAEKLRQLKQLFPEAFAETQSIDWERLKTALAEFSKDAGQPRERYGLTWPGKNECLKIIQQASTATLKPDRKQSVHFDDTQNLFIEGDNLEALKLLQKAYYGKVKSITIDPPYNTGKDFVYKDNWKTPLKEYLRQTGQLDANGRKTSANPETNGRKHSRWLSMMWPRLYLARNLLADNGAIFISIDDHENHNLRHLLDEIFGQENFIAQFVWHSRYSISNDTQTVCRQHEMVICYCKDIDEFQIGMLPRTEKMDSGYKNPDDDERGPWQSVSLHAKSGSGNPYNLTFPNGVKFEFKPGLHPRFSKSKLLELYHDNRLLFGKDGKQQPRYKVFLSEVKQGRTPVSVVHFNEVGHTDEAAKEVGKLVGTGLFDHPKPVRLIEHLLRLSTLPAAEGEEGDIVLDFFAGSCTTAHAVMKLNKEDNGNRRFIMVQLPEKYPENSEAFKAGFKTIADIGKERIRRAAAKLADDSGFQVFQLDESNFKVWDSTPTADVKEIQRRLEMHVNHINPKSSKEDILYEILLKAGHPLTTHIKEENMAGTKIYSVDNGKLFLCLEKITLKAVHAMAKAEPEEVICLDSCFAGNDELKTNAYYYFKCRSTVPGDYPEILFRTV